MKYNCEKCIGSIICNINLDDKRCVYFNKALEDSLEKSNFTECDCCDKEATTHYCEKCYCDKFSETMVPS